jgi:hypothetical protein
VILCGRDSPHLATHAERDVVLFKRVHQTDRETTVCRWHSSTLAKLDQPAPTRRGTVAAVDCDDDRWLVIHEHLSLG